MKPLRFSKLTRNINSTSNLNFYIGGFPVSSVNVNPDTTNATRYREYLIGLNSVALGTNSLSAVVDSYYNSIFIETTKFDFFSGASGSAVYDQFGALVGIIQQGHPSRTTNFLYPDNQYYSFLGNDDTQYNPSSFYNVIKKLSYLYPEEYSDIFKK